jgi:hypothetical protein
MSIRAERLTNQTANAVTAVAGRVRSQLKKHSVKARRNMKIGHRAGLLAKKTDENMSRRPIQVHLMQEVHRKQYP